MNTLERHLNYPFGDELPEPGTKFQVAPGVYWIRKPLPFALDHINLWLLRDQFEGRTGWTAVDCGVATEATRNLWKQIIADELEGLPIVRVICTHYHPDHLGNAAWLTDQFDCPLWMTFGEYAMGRVVLGQFKAAAAANNVAHFVAHGLTSEDHIEKLKHRGNLFSMMVPEMPRSFRRIFGGEEIAIGGRHWRVISGFGHSPEHASLYAGDLHVLIAGDMILPRISPNIGVHAMEPEANPLHNFLASLERIGASTAEETLTLPSHGKPFRKLRVRIKQLHSHHRDRLDEIRAICVAPKTTADVVPIMFKRELDTHQLFFAFGEALAHLNYLWYAGDLNRELCIDGVYRFALKKYA